MQTVMLQMAGPNLNKVEHMTTSSIVVYLLRLQCLSDE